MQTECKFKTNLLNFGILLMLGCLLFLGCQQSGGDLKPLNSENVTVITSRFENDTAQIVDKGITVKFYGTWGGGDAIVLRVIINNETGKTGKINFDKFILRNGRQKRQTVNHLRDKINGSILKAESVILGAGERRAFDVRFLPPFGDSLRADAAEQTLYFQLPIEIGTETRQFEAVFEAIGEKSERGKADPQDW